MQGSHFCVLQLALFIAFGTERRESWAGDGGRSSEPISLPGTFLQVRDPNLQTELGAACQAEKLCQTEMFPLPLGPGLPVSPAESSSPIQLLCGENQPVKPELWYHTHFRLSAIFSSQYRLQLHSF